MISLSDIQEVMEKVRLLYKKKGLFFAQVMLSPQKIKGGQILLHVFEGKIHDIHIICDDEKEGRYTQRNMIYRGKNNVLREGEVKRMTQYLKSFQSMDVHFVLKPSKEKGKGEIAIYQKNNKKDYFLSLRMDNNSVVGTWSGGAHLLLENTLSCYEKLNFAYTHDFGTGTALRETFYVSGECPYGQWQCHTGLQYFRYHSDILGEDLSFRYKAKQVLYTIDVAYSLKSRRKMVDKLLFKYKRKYVHNYIEDIYIESASYEYSSLSFALKCERHKDKFFNIEYGIECPLDRVEGSYGIQIYAISSYIYPIKKNVSVLKIDRAFRVHVGGYEENRGLGFWGTGYDSRNERRKTVCQTWYFVSIRIQSQYFKE